MRLHFPSDYGTRGCALVMVDISLLPIIAGLLKPLEEERSWVAEDFQTAYRAITKLEATLMTDCMSTLVQEIRDFRGVMPAYESVPVLERTSAMYNSLNDSFARLLELRGIMSDGWFTDTYTTLKDVVQAGRGNTSSAGDSMMSEVSTILDGGSDPASLIEWVITTLANQEATVLQSGMEIAQISLLGAIAGILQVMSSTQQIQSTALQAIIEALRGTTVPTDNILQSIRGDTPADVDRNLVQLLS